MSRIAPGLLALVLLTPTAAFAQEKEDIKELKLRDWQPRSMLITRTTDVPKPAFPVIDVHNHLGGGNRVLTPERVRHYVAEMDAAGVRTVVNLDGGWGERLKESIAALDNAYPGRFLTYALLDFSGIDEPDWSQRENCATVRELRRRCQGLEVSQDARPGRALQGRPVPAGRRPQAGSHLGDLRRYKRPIEIHTADPGAFFTPLDRHSERWHELNEHPEWLFHGKDFPSRSELHAQRNRVIARHPRTTFICAHGQ